MNHDPAFIVHLLMDDCFQAWVKHPTPELNRYWEEYLRQHPDEQPLVERARQVLQHLSFAKSEAIGREGILQRALNQAGAASHPIAPLRPWLSWYRGAAVLVGALLVTAAYWYTLPATQVHTTAYGESERVVLPDGSTVVLNANSTLRYPQQWDEQRPRQVELTGEAFFSVTHQANQQKFIVRTNNLAIEVLGTEFNVNHRRGETEVVLAQGEIRLDWQPAPITAASHQPLLLKPGECVVFSEDERAATKKVVNPEVYSSWTDQRWLFEQTPLTEVFAMIEDNYGYRVVAEPATLADKVFTAEIADAQLDLLLSFLSESFNLEITKGSRVITLRQRSAVMP